MIRFAFFSEGNSSSSMESASDKSAAIMARRDEKGFSDDGINQESSTKEEMKQ